MLRITTIRDHQRMSTQELLLTIEAAVARGETDFCIEASGQHDIGGPLWNPEGRPLSFRISNPGQRVGSMCLPGTSVRVEGAAPADVGWLNAGGNIAVRGDAGDTAGHCAAAGSIYIGGRAGTRTGSLMKHDPLYDPPELWVLRNVGSFSFEFMGGGKAVVCGHESQTLPSVLGDRPCVGMVGGVVYFRGPVGDLSDDVEAMPLDAEDIAWLDAGMDGFLEAIDQPRLRRELSLWKHWRKIVPATARHTAVRPSMCEFRTHSWVRNGIFGDVCPDDLAVNGLVATGEDRLRIPRWENARFAAPCQSSCPASIPTQRRFNLLREGRYDEARALALDYTPFPGSVCGSVCPNPCMDGCTRKILDSPVQIGPLGLASAGISVPRPTTRTGRHVGVIGGGVGGLSAAWQLARMGHDVTVYEADSRMGGKLAQVIPHRRLDQDMLAAELARIASLGVRMVTSHPVDAAAFARLRKKHDALIVATGGHVGRVFPWPGHERVVPGIDFLKAVNRGEAPAVPARVVVIGCGNAGMDTAAGAFAMGAGEVTCIDVQRPAAFAHEIAHIESLGGKVLWPVRTKEITDKGVLTEDGTLIPADMVLVAVGEIPDLSYLPEGVGKFRDWLAPAPDMSILDGVFAAGDVLRPGLLADAIGSGRRAALAADAWLAGARAQGAERDRMPARKLRTAWFARGGKGEVLPAPEKDFERCISCGTCRDCKMCLKSCPENAIERVTLPDGFAYVSDDSRCIGCGICAGICPCGIWTMQPNGPQGAGAE